MSVIKKSFEYLKKYGLPVCINVLKDNIFSKKYPNNYANYRKLGYCNEGHTLSYNPKVSIIAHCPSDKTLESIENQIYKNIEIIKISESKRAESYNKGIKSSTGDYVCFLDSGDILENNAIYEMVKCLNKNLCSMVYCDDDTINGESFEKPFFKPCFSPHTLLSFCYIGFAVFDREKAAKIGVNTDYSYEEYYDFLLKFTNENKDVYKIDRVLCHKKEHIENIEEIKILKQSILMTRNIRATVDNSGQVIFQPDCEKVSIIIPSKDNVTMLKKCLYSVSENTDYEDYEIIVVDNGSTKENSDIYREMVSALNGKYIYEKMEFNFSAMCNKGAEIAQGKYLLFLNDDIEISNKSWLKAMVGYCQLPEIGAVGIKLLYPENNAIQHCGVINIQNGPVHSFSGCADGDYYFGRTTRDYNVSAVTGACLMVRKSEFSAFDQELAVAYNDVDLCFSLLEKGLFNLCINHISLYHHESVSRGNDGVDEKKLLRLYRERNKLDNKHREFISNDIFYNTNLTQHKADFSIEKLNRVFASKPVGLIKNYERYIDSGAEYAIEYIHYRDYITVGGYAAFHKGGLCKINILLFVDDVALVLETDREMRFELSALKNKNLNLSGFKCRIDDEIISKGQYEIGILLTSLLGGKHIVKTGCMIDITV